MLAGPNFTLWPVGHVSHFKRRTQDVHHIEVQHQFFGKFTNAHSVEISTGFLKFN